MSGSDFKYDLFLSYRRKDGLAWAKWLRGRLIRYRLPATFGERSKSRLQVYQDTAYERVDSDYWTNTVLPALSSSRYLCVLITPGVLEVGPDGEPNWVEREIAAFNALPQGANVFAVTAIETKDGSLPGGLRQKFPLMEQVDVRDLRPIWNRFLRWGKLQSAVSTVAAALYNIRPEEMPLFRREEDIRKRRRIITVTLAAILLVGVVSALGIAWWNQKNVARRRQQDAQHEAAISQAAALRSAAEMNVSRKGNLLESSLLLATEAAKRQEMLGVIDPATYDLLFKTLRLQPSDIRTLHPSYIFKAGAFSPDGTLLATGDEDGTLRLWRTADGTMVDTKKINKELQLVAFSSDGHFLAACGRGQGVRSDVENADQALSVWRITNQSTLGFVRNLSSDGEVRYVTPDGRSLIVVDKDGVRSWVGWESDHPSLTPLLAVKDVVFVAATDDGRYLGLTREVYDFSSDERLSYPRYPVEIYDNWTSTARKIFSKVFDSKDFEPSGLRSKGAFEVTGLSFDPKEPLVAITGGAPSKPLAELWDYKKNKLELSLRDGHSDQILPVAFSREGRYVAVPSRDPILSVWNVDERKEVGRSQLEQSALMVAFNSKDVHQFASAAWDGTARVWRIGDPQGTQRLEFEEVSRMSHRAEVAVVKFSPDGSTIFSMDPGIGHLWHLAVPQNGILDTHAAPTGVSFSADGRYLVARTADGRFWLFEKWNTLQPLSKKMEPKEGHSQFSDAQISADGRFVVSVDVAGAAQLWSVPDLELQDEASGSEDYSKLRQSLPRENVDLIFTRIPARVAISRDNQLAATSIPVNVIGGETHSELRIYEIVDERRLKLIRVVPMKNSANPITFSEDRYLAIGERSVEGVIRFIETSKLLSDAPLDLSALPGLSVPGFVSSISFSSKGHFVAITHGRTDVWKNWEERDGSKIQKLEVNSDFAQSAVLTSDGSYLATAGFGRAVQVWRLSQANTLSSAETMRLTSPEAFTAIGLSPDQKYLVTGGNDLRMLVVPWRIHDLIIESCRHVGRNLTTEEWKEYGGDGECPQTCPNVPVCATK